MTSFSDLMEEQIDTPTTAKMDGIITEDDIRDRYKVHAQCRSCNQWTAIEGDAERHVMIGGYTKGEVCEHCGRADFDSHSVTSKRTWNPVTAKKRRPKKK